MRLKKISWRNFKSYSNILTEIPFTNNSSLNLIIGENGTGKSSITFLPKSFCFQKKMHYLCTQSFPHKAPWPKPSGLKARTNFLLTTHLTI